MYTAFFLVAALALSANAFPIDADTFSDVPATGLVERDNWAVIRNDLSGPCKPITIIFARGTSELGNVGSLAGPPFFNALGDIVGDSNVDVQGVNYGATIAGYLAGGDPAGAATLASLTRKAATQCPDTQIVLGGYRYGPTLVHLASLLIPIQPRSASCSSGRCSTLRVHGIAYQSRGSLWRSR